MGLDEFSMTASYIPLVKQMIRSVSFESCKALAEQALNGRCIADIRAAVEQWMAANAPVESYGTGHR